jgi:ornithine carbamoyltransferase
MWQRFTERSRRLVVYAQEEAARFGQSAVTPEHLLLGLLREPDSIALLVLEHLGASPGRLRTELELQLPRASTAVGTDLELNPSAKAVMNSAYEEARRLEDHYVGTEHVLLGLIRQQDSVAARILTRQGAELDRARTEVRSTHAREEHASGLMGSLQERLKNLVALRRELGKAGDEDGAAIHLHGEWSYLDALLALTKQAPQERSPASAAANALLAVDLARAVCQNLRDLTSIRDLSRDQAWALLCLACVFRGTLGVSKTAHQEILAGKSLAMIFEKPSLRTRVSFEVGLFQLGGHAVYLQPSDISMGKRETVADVAHNLERMVDGIMARVFAHRTIVELAEHSRVPVINGLCDREHPCQALADLLTVWEKRGAIEGQRIAYVGDGNNVANSLLLLGARLGASVVIASPPGYEPDPDLVAAAGTEAAARGATVQVTNDPRAACTGADVIYTDTWASMGQETEAAERAKVFAPYQVTAELTSLASPDHLFMHCLPAHRGEEVTAEVLDGPNSVVFDEAENRLHAQKAVMAVLMG